MWMQVSGGGMAGPIDVSAAASSTACMAWICKAAKPPKSAPVGLPMGPEKSGVDFVADRNQVGHRSGLAIRHDFGF